MPAAPYDERSALGAPFPAVRRGVLLLVLLLSLAGIGNHDLWTPDEPREAALALALRRSGDLVVPRLAGEPFVEKPPLFYIAAAGVLAALGPWLGATAALRLTPALFGLGTLFMTGLIGRRLWGARGGLLAMLVLALMPGFVHVSHWLLVDTALMFFVTAGCWCLLEAYLGGRQPMLALAGVCAAGAFLSKGLVGPLVLGLGWLGLFAPWLRRDAAGRGPAWWSVAWHVCGALLFALLAGAWITAFYRRGGAELWREWFWHNHFGRFTGQARDLGHVRWWGYYLPVLPLYILPWLAAWLAGLAEAAARIRRRQRLEPGWPFLLAWGLGGLALLSMSACKREIYLAVLLPALALMATPALRAPSSAVRRFLNGWTLLALAALAAAAAAPAAIRLGLPARQAGLYAALALAAMAAAVWFLRRLSWLDRVLLVTAAAYLALLAVAVPLVDRVKSYGPAFRELAAALAPDARPAAWRFDETTRAGFYYYCGLVFPPVSDSVELQAILGGRHPRWNSVLARGFPPADADLPPWRIVAEQRLGARRRLLWVSGQPPAGPE